MSAPRRGEMFGEEFLPPLEQRNLIKSQVLSFVAKHRQRSLCLVTSGGTTVPLEQQPVRSLANFSTGQRGSFVAEELLRRDKAVIFLTAKSGCRPFASQLLLNPYGVLSQLSSDGGGEISAELQLAVDECRRFSPLLFIVEYTTVFEYLLYLELTCRALSTCPCPPLIVLAAAVSDFYIPFSNMSKGKIESNPNGVAIQLVGVPKRAKFIKEVWCPTAFLVLFKLETEKVHLFEKARRGLAATKADCVVANLLQTYREEFWILDHDDEGSKGIYMKRKQGRQLERCLVEMMMALYNTAS